MKFLDCKWLELDKDTWRCSRLPRRLTSVKYCTAESCNYFEIRLNYLKRLLREAKFKMGLPSGEERDASGKFAGAK